MRKFKSVLKSYSGIEMGRGILRLMPLVGVICFGFWAVTVQGQLQATFQPPTDEELKMTAEPKAPGAAAIYLYREEMVDDNLHMHSFRARIKVLTEKGKELATVEVPYYRSEVTITDIKARTIHADGKVIPLDVKPSDLVDVKSGSFQQNRKVFTLPSVEVGSILEYKWSMRYSDDQLSSPHWDIQQPYFVRKAHYSFVDFNNLDQVTDSKGRAANRLLYSYKLPEGSKVVYETVTHRYLLDVADVPPVPHEEYMPPIGSWIEAVNFYYTHFNSKDEFWKVEGENWSKGVDHFAEASKGLKDAVGPLVSAGDSEDAKSKKLYDAVMALENTDYTRKKSQVELKQLHERAAKNAEDVWKQKSGDSRELAELYLAMARIAGLKAYALIVSNRDQEIFDPYLLSMNQLDDTLVIVSVGGQDKVLDPGAKFASYGDLQWKHTQAGGIRQSDKGVAVVTTSVNAYKDASTMEAADLTLGADGAVTGTIRITMTGPEAMRWRQLAIANDEDEVKKRFDEHAKGMVPDGVTAEFGHFVSLADYHVPLMAVVKISGNMGTATGKRVFLPGVFFETRAKSPFVAAEKRDVPVDMGYASLVQEDVTYHLPDAFAIESSPADTSIPWTGHAVMQLKAMPDGKDVRITRSFVRGFAMVQPKEYADLRDFYQKVATADQQQLVLTRADGGAGKTGNE